LRIRGESLSTSQSEFTFVSATTTALDISGLNLSGTASELIALIDDALQYVTDARTAISEFELSLQE
jgi:hypothetical protein